jgi:subtilisin family serine protease
VVEPRSYCRVGLGAPGGDADLQTDDQGWRFDLVLSTAAAFTRSDDGEITGDPTYYWDWAAGTSMAAPNVSGAGALVKANNSEYNPAQTKSALKRAADVPEGYDKTSTGRAT